MTRKKKRNKIKKQTRKSRKRGNERETKWRGKKKENGEKERERERERENENLWFFFSGSIMPDRDFLRLLSLEIGLPKPLKKKIRRKWVKAKKNPTPLLGGTWLQKENNSRFLPGFFTGFFFVRKPSVACSLSSTTCLSSFTGFFYLTWGRLTCKRS